MVVRRTFSAAAAKFVLRGGSAQRGVIMLDMVIAVALLALLILLVLPTLPRGTSAARLGGYASEVAALLKSDRTAASRAGGEVATRINLAERKVISGGATSRAVSLPEDVTLDVVASDACRTPGNELAIVFGADGRTCGAVITLGRGNLNWRVRVNWLTGFIDVVPPNRQG